MKDKYEILNKKYESKRGFTILESLVAIFVLSLAISGAFSAVRQSLHQSILSKDEVKAFYLAQEVMEIVRNKRDTNQLAFISDGTTNWLTGITSNASDNCYFGKVCSIDASSYNFVSLGSTYCGSSWGSCQNLRQNQTDFRYGYNIAWANTNFKREVMLESVNGDEISMTVRITWTKGMITKEFKVKTHLFKWI